MSRLIATFLATLSCVGLLAAEERRFDIEVESVLSKASCNAGTCHGNQNGKGGLKLSLRGQDPTFDYNALVLENAGRRINLLEPQKSLLLQKPTMEVAHQGGKRFSKDAKLYSYLQDWIEQGAKEPTGSTTVDQLIVEPLESIQFAPESKIQLSVSAEFSDGTRRDVSDIAVYEASNLNVEAGDAGLVRRAATGEATVIVRYLSHQVPVRIAFLPSRDEFVWNGRETRNYVDEHVFARLKAFRSNPAPRCSDSTFIRRAYLDLLGVIPTATEAREFVASDDPEKRSRLIASLFSRPEFADHWALKWADLLRVEEKVLDRQGVEVFHGWIRNSIAAGKPLNEFVADLLLARGSTYDNPPANFFRALRKTNQRGEAAARVFLGTRLQCAQCHNHPFDRWTQDDYYAWSSLFSRLDYKVIENKRHDRLDKNQFNGEQFVQVKHEGESTNPTTGEVMHPKFLGADNAVDDDHDRLRSLAEWLTSPDNRQFARSQVNRLWYHLMGKGLVNPVDDFRITNPASHPKLLELLTDDFIGSGFDIRHVLRVIMESETYQLSSSSDETAEYAEVPPRRLTAEQLLDSQALAIGGALKFNGFAEGMRATQLPGVHKVRARDEAPSPADRFLFAFGKPERQMTCECERSDSTTLSQALFLVNGDCIDDLLSQQGNLIGKSLEEDRSLDEIIDELYWSSLSREPTSEERNHTHSILARSPSKRQGLEDVAWALLNAKEFVFRQ